MIALVSGFMVAAYAVAALFFLRFWKDTRDRLFALFSASFLILALQRAALTLVVQQGETPVTTLLYGVRLLAFLLILAAIIDKNRSS